jgi:hypothetical protein
MISDCAAVIIMDTHAKGILCGYRDAVFNWRHNFYDAAKKEVQETAVTIISKEEMNELLPIAETKIIPEEEEVIPEETETLSEEEVVPEEIETPPEEEAIPEVEETPVPEPTEPDITQRFRMSLDSRDNNAAPVNTMETLQQLFVTYPPAVPFAKQSRDAKWVAIQLSDTVPLKSKNLMEENFVKNAFERFGHILIGLISDTVRPQYIIGVPDVFNPEGRSQARKLGFMQFKCTEPPADISDIKGEFGYWLMFINL